MPSTTYARPAMPSDWIYYVAATETICHKITSLIGGVQ